MSRITRVGDPRIAAGESKLQSMDAKGTDAGFDTLPPAPVLVDGTYWRSIFLTLAELHPPAWLLEFADGFPMRLGQSAMAGADLLDYVIFHRGKVPEDWDFGATIFLERFLAGKGCRDAAALHERALNRNNHSTWIPAKTIIRTAFRFLWRVRAIKDSRAVVFNLVSLISRAMFPNQRFAVISKGYAEGGCRAILLIATDKTYRTAQAANIDFAMLPQMKKAPLALGLPEFEEVAVLADCRPIGSVLWEGEDGSARPVENEKVPFRRFCEDSGVSMMPAGLPNALVEVASRDVFCAARNRNVIHKGCAYGAPVYLLEFRYAAYPWKDTLDRFKPLLDDVGVGDDASELRTLAGLRDMLRSRVRPQVLIFDSVKRRIKSGKKVLATGYMADTLRILIHSLGREREVEVPVLDLRDHEWLHGARSVNHYIVNKRLKERLSKRFPLLEMDMQDRGRIRFRRHGEVELRTLDAPPVSKAPFRGA